MLIDARAARNDGHGRCRLATVLNKLFADVRRLHRAHVDRQRLAALGEMRPVERRAVGLVVAGHKGHALGVIAVGQRNTGVGRHRRGRRDAGHHLERYARFGCAACSSSPPRPKINGSPPFRRTTVLPAFAGINQHLVGVVLRHRVLACAFADADLLRIATDQLAHAIGDQVVVEHHVRILQNLQAAQRQ